ncbi:hypothetical protein R3P38DRAFT_2792642 [Favolaschia claudopus]|uniref:Uncharacterized protein n=1 Tax=Favolaschia claudopus TaxID=2862362 RepID=A0AAW0ADG0_9AGAR
MGIDGGHEETRGVGLGGRPAVIVADIETKSLFTVCGTISGRVGDGKRDVGETMSALVVELMVLGRLVCDESDVEAMRGGGGGDAEAGSPAEEKLDEYLTCHCCMMSLLDKSDVTRCYIRAGKKEEGRGREERGGRFQFETEGRSRQDAEVESGRGRTQNYGYQNHYTTGRVRVSGDCQPTREEHKEGRQRGWLEPAGWWEPIRNKTKVGPGRAGARPDEGGHVIGPDEGPGESDEPGELGKVERSTGGLPKSQGMSKGRGRGSMKSSRSRDKSGREGDEREEIRTVQQNKR